MFHWFTWKGKNSLADFGLWIGKLPKFQRAQERYTNIQIPGRAGSLILLEGDDVYEDYQLEVTIITRNRNPKIQAALAWLSGAGDLHFSNEGDFVHEARIVNTVEFARIGNDLLQCKVQFLCSPFKKKLIEEEITVNQSMQIFNPGDVASRPYITATGDGQHDLTISIADRTMTLTNVPQLLNIDCDAGVITYYPTSPGPAELWTGSFTGDFLLIPPGWFAIVKTGTPNFVIKPRWRWK